MIRGPRPRPTGTNAGRNDGIAKRRQRSAARRAAGSRRVPIVATKRGNSTEGPRGAKGTPFQTTVGGKHGGCIGTRGRVHETPTDRGLARQSPEMGFTSLAY